MVTEPGFSIFRGREISAARNYGLDRCTGEWILYIDADECVRPESAAGLRAELAAESFVAYEVSLHPVQGFTSYRILRLFRNDPEIRFRGVIHENLWPAVQEYRSRHGGETGISKLTLDHSGYEGDRERKNARNLPLLLKGVQEDPARVYSWCHLANIYTDMQQHQLAEQAWTNALDLVRKKRRLGRDDVLPYIGLLQRGYDLGRDVNALFAEAVSRFPSNLNLQWMRGRLLMRESRFDEAIPVFERLVERGATGDYDHLVAYDLRLFQVFSYDALAVCYFRLRRYAESCRYYQLAARGGTRQPGVSDETGALLAARAATPNGREPVMPFRWPMFSTPPQISVIIPTYNRPDELRLCLEGFCQQTVDAEKFEIILVDDGSTEDTPQR